jgi:trans-aconitate 2-methyltransferase
MWSPTDYLKYGAERARPFADLLGQVRKEHAKVIVDLGCGPGNNTLVLAECWPSAHVVGVDNSAGMLKMAWPLTIPGRLEFFQEDINNWRAHDPVDLLLSNAALQWVPDHVGLLKRLTDMLAADGILAVQMPSRFGTAMYAAIEETVADPRWASYLTGIGLNREAVKPVTWYVEQLHDLGFAVNAWETTYIHTLTGENPVLEWLKGTALRPLLDQLRPEHAGEFMQALGGRLLVDYPARRHATLLSMPRLFFVAARAG